MRTENERSTNACAGRIEKTRYNKVMTTTTKLEKALQYANQLPSDLQDELADYILAETGEPLALSEAERAAIAEGQADFAAGRVASDEEVQAVFDRARSR